MYVRCRNFKRGKVRTVSLRDDSVPMGLCKQEVLSLYLPSMHVKSQAQCCRHLTPDLEGRDRKIPRASGNQSSQNGKLAPLSMSDPQKSRWNLIEQDTQHPPPHLARYTHFSYLEYIVSPK